MVRISKTRYDMNEKKVIEDRQRTQQRIIERFGLVAVNKNKQKYCSKCARSNDLWECKENLIPMQTDGKPCSYFIEREKK